MRVEGETAYEPDLLVLMEQFEEVIGKKKNIWNEATIVKDRSTLLHGKTFRMPNYETFAPTIDAMLENPLPKNTVMTPEQDAGVLFRTEEEKGEWRRERDKWIEEVDGLLTRIAPATTGKDKQLKLDLLDMVFGTTSDTAIRELSPEALKTGYKFLIEKAVELGAAEWFDKPNGSKGLRRKMQKENDKEK